MKLALLLSAILLVTVACTTPQARAQVASPTPEPTTSPWRVVQLEFNTETGQAWIEDRSAFDAFYATWGSEWSVVIQSLIQEELASSANSMMDSRLGQWNQQWKLDLDPRLANMDSAVTSLNSGIDRLQVEVNDTQAVVAAVGADAAGIQDTIVPLQQLYLDLLNWLVDVQDALGRLETQVAALESP